jgi:signal transduction histidine kinase
MFRSISDDDERTAAHWGASCSGYRVITEFGVRMFDPNWQASPCTTESSMGLGLHICKLIAGAHGGTLTAASEEKRGTTFELSWPMGCEGPAT